METLTLVGVLAGSLGLTALARRFNLSAPLVIVVVALGVAVLPGVPRIELEPELILTLVLPPLLYSTSLESSLTHFRANLRSIVSLGVLLVVVTAFVIAFVVHLILPDLPWASALVLGAVVSPPDAVTAVAIGRRLGLPRGIMAVLTGESLVNDAAALTLYKVALAAVAGTAGSLGHGFAVFAVATVLGIAVGLVFGLVVDFLRSRLDDPMMESAFGIVVPFAAYVTAEHLHPFGPEFSGSGVLAVVSAGLFLGYRSLGASPATRMQDRSVWSSIDLMLEALVFALVGLQLPFVLEGAQNAARDNGTLAAVAAVVLGVTMFVRIPAVFLSAYLPKSLQLIGRTKRDPTSWRSLAVVSWTGMRGVVTIAAASGVPENTPGRAEIQLFAFTVAVGTVLIQGLTLPPLIRLLKVQDPDEEARDQAEELAAREVAQKAAHERLRELSRDKLSKMDIEPEKLQRLQERLERVVDARYRFAQASITLSGEERRATPQAQFARARRELLITQRAAMIEENRAGRLDDDVLQRVLRELDLEEMAVSTSIRNRMA
ncbi:Na+/H+ antiporter [Amycolatopsis jiangsuensis]|uniref:CPA1 family monovalent cation:H+ antiporter n=1 Tax=Amycolatopsis jiangsuensis TaxID=1181879 RepID=A0A840J1X2_9PSEU|nr:Na+/H+ antiporter [Amycolatopsis jiangsuensis]MBB4687487.1 CPA1 family monovalent cation:H+ antiporter [Amycolatopsis jiangsuensis]